MEEKVQALIEKYRKAMGLHRWYISLHFKPVKRGVAETEIDWPYQAAAVTLNLKHVDLRSDDNYLAMVIRHELAHILIAPITHLLEKSDCDEGLATDMEEYTVTLLERMPVWDD
jgi:predicted SprT family Zn-dependent metalloprotease